MSTGNDFKIRRADPRDAGEISAFLFVLERLGKRDIPSDVKFVLEQYIEHPEIIRCSVAEGSDGALLGVQILRLATQNNAYDVPPGWGIIGTHINPVAFRRGIGRALFDISLREAQAAKLPYIDATTRDDNAEALGYYPAMGFEIYLRSHGRVRMMFRV